MAQSGPAVDVILPTWRAGPWVHEAIESVLAQTHRSLRVTVVDDASGDGTAEAIEARWGRAGGRLVILCLARRVGAAAARNEAVRRTGSPLLAFIDQDHRWRPAKLERQIARLGQAPEVQLVHTDLVHVDEAGRERRGEADADNALRRAVAWERLDRDALLRRCFGGAGIRLASALVRRDAFEAVGGFDARFFGGEEWALWVQLAAAGWRMAHVAEPLTERRIHAGNASDLEVVRRRKGHFAAIAAVVARHPELAPLADPLRARVLRSEVLAHLRAGRGSEARQAARLLRGLRGTSAELAALWLLSFASAPLPTLARIAAAARKRALP